MRHEVYVEGEWTCNTGKRYELDFVVLIPLHIQVISRNKQQILLMCYRYKPVQ